MKVKDLIKALSKVDSDLEVGRYDLGADTADLYSFGKDEIVLFDRLKVKDNFIDSDDFDKIKRVELDVGVSD